MTSYMYIAIRRDLSPAQQIVQSVHAAIEASELYYDLNVEHPTVIVLGVDSLHELIKFTNYVNYNHLNYKCFHEPNMDNEMTSVAVYPIYTDERKLFKKYKLL